MNSIVVIEELYDKSRCLKFSHNAGVFSMCMHSMTIVTDTFLRKLQCEITKVLGVIHND